MYFIAMSCFTSVSNTTCYATLRPSFTSTLFKYLQQVPCWKYFLLPLVSPSATGCTVEFVRHRQRLTTPLPCHFKSIWCMTNQIWQTANSCFASFEHFSPPLVDRVWRKKEREGTVSVPDLLKATHVKSTLYCCTLMLHNVGDRLKGVGRLGGKSAKGDFWAEICSLMLSIIC